MRFLDWMNRDGQAQEKKLGHEPIQSSTRIKQPGDPFKRGDRVVIYEAWHLGRELKPDPQHAPGIVLSIHHNGTLVRYERGGRLPAHAAVEDVRHATELDVHKYGNEFAAIEAKVAQQRRPLDAPESSRKTLPHPRPSWER